MSCVVVFGITSMTTKMMIMTFPPTPILIPLIVKEVSVPQANLEAEYGTWLRLSNVPPLVQSWRKNLVGGKILNGTRFIIMIDTKSRSSGFHREAALITFLELRDTHRIQQRIRTVRSPGGMPMNPDYCLSHQRIQVSHYIQFGRHLDPYQ